MVVAQVSTSPQGGRSSGFGGRGCHAPRIVQSMGFGDSYGSSGFGSWRDAFGTRSGAASADEGGNIRRGFRKSRGVDEDRPLNTEDCLHRAFRPGCSEEDWNTSGGTGSFTRGFRAPGRTEEDANTSREEGSGGFPRGFRNGSGRTEEDWDSSREEGRGFPRGKSGWTEEDAGGAPRRKSCARPCCNKEGDEHVRGFGGRTGARSAGFLRSGFARQVEHKGPGQAPGDMKKEPKFASAYIRKGKKMVPRDVNYDYLRMYIQRIDRTVKRGRNKGIMRDSASKDKQLMNDFVYFLSQADQELRLRLEKARRTGQGECSCCSRRNNAKVPIFNANTNNSNVEDEDEEW